MRSGFKAIYAVGSTALILASGAAMAQESTGITGINFGANATVNSGTCPAGLGPNCKVLAFGADFAQRQFVIDGQTYIQTVIADPNNPGFKSEDFVRLAGTQGSVQGVSSKLGIAQDTATSKFGTVSLIKSGWASAAGLADPTGAAGKNITDAKITLGIGDAVGTTNEFSSVFNVDATFDGNVAGATNKINSLSVEQLAVLGDLADKQHFKTVIQTAKTSQTGVVLIGDNRQAGQGLTPVTWTVGTDTVQMTWVGQEFKGANTSFVGSFGAESVQKLDLANSANNVASFGSNLINAAPINWGTPGKAEIISEFGQGPVLGTPPPFPTF